MIIESFKTNILESDSLLLSYSNETTEMMVVSLYIPPQKLKNVFITEVVEKINGKTIIIFKLLIDIESDQFELLTRSKLIANCCLRMIKENKDISMSIITESYPELFV